MMTIRRVVFIQKDVFAKPGVMALSAVLKSAGFDCRVVVADLDRDVVRAVLKLEPDVVAFSITTGGYPFMKEVGTRLRETYDKPIICGGPHPTFYPEVIHDPYLDALCQGEGDDAILAFLQALQNGDPTETIPNLWVKKDGTIHKMRSGPSWRTWINCRFSTVTFTKATTSIRGGGMTFFIIT